MFSLTSKLVNQNYPEVTLSDITGSSKLLVPGKVISSTRIAQGALSRPINPETLKGVTDVVQISVGVDLFGSLNLDTKSKEIWNSDVHWTRALRIAEDCHSYNIQLRKDSQFIVTKTGEKVQALILQAVRPVEPGQELLLWFSEEILATLHMGFLTPANIQGQKNYVCTKCSALYESPNPLKLHLTLNCGKQTMTWFWEQMSNTLSQRTSMSSPEFQFNLISENLIPKQKNAIDLSSPYIKKPESGFESAFKPFKKLPSPAISNIASLSALNTLNLSLQQNNNVYSTPTPHAPSNWPRFTMPSDYVHVHTPYHFPTNQLPRSCTDDAQIETLVSSLGKYKEGHVCLYCGKSYSRKYGLKIHIRTHTGYKPLKCKFCLRPFGDPSNLNKHVRLHAEGETPYKCAICGKVLVRRRDLERHMRSRHSDDLTTSTFITEEDSSFMNSSDDEPKSTNDSDANESENIDIEDNSNTNDDAS